MKYKNIIFDLDGTLLNTKAGIIEAVLYAINELGYRDLTDKELDSFIGPPIQTSLINHFNCSKEEAQKGADIFRNYYKDVSLFNANPYNGIYALLGFIVNHHMDIGVATYKREDYAVDLLKHFKFDDYCKVMHGADNYNRMTKADIINLCISEMRGVNTETLYIGDTMSDFKAASESGADFLGVTYGFGFEKNKEYEFHTVNEPADIIAVLMNTL